MRINIIICIVLVIVYNVAALDFPKCSMKNSTCQKDLFQRLAREYAPTGIPEIGIGTLDPIYLKWIKMVVMQILKLTLVEGECLDLRTCTLTKYDLDVDNFRRTSEILCKRIVIQGRYTISTNPYFRQIIGDVTGCGNGTIVVEDWYFKVVYPFGFVKREDGKIYTDSRFREGYYVSEVQKKFTVTADIVKVNGRDVTKKVLAFINKYWKIVLKTFGKCFHEISMEYYYDTYNKFFTNVPATEYLSDDLTLYLEKSQNCTSRH